MRKALSLFAAAVMSSATAQEFLFVSDRLPAEPAYGASGNALRQNELFLYRDGSEIRLTFTPDEAEWDPAPSPSGKYVAYVVNDTIIDYQAVEWPETWNWSVRLMELETGLLLEEWPLPGTSGIERVAGGFSIAWYPDEQSLLVQALAPDLSGLVALLERGDPEPRILGRGFGVSLDPERGWFATSVDGHATVFDPISGHQYPLRAGQPLGWAGTDLVIGGPEMLSVYDPVTAEQVILDEGTDYYYSQFTVSPDGLNYAWIRYSYGAGSVITVASSDLSERTSWQTPDYAAELRWLDDSSLLLTGIVDGSLALSRVSADGSASWVLVGTRSDNFNAVPMP